VKDSLYVNGIEKKEPAYSMNWFMSGVTRDRIRKRLEEQPVVREMVRQYSSPKQ
jgi:hypothetical protein